MGTPEDPNCDTCQNCFTCQVDVSYCQTCQNCFACQDGVGQTCSTGVTAPDVYCLTCQNCFSCQDAVSSCQTCQNCFTCQDAIDGVMDTNKQGGNQSVHPPDMNERIALALGMLADKLESLEGLLQKMLDKKCM